MALNFLKLRSALIAMMLVMGLSGCHGHEKGVSIESGAAAASVGQASDTPMAELNGFVWQASGPQSKLDFLLGVECAMAMEAALKQVADEQGGQVELSRFANGWQIAFRDKARPDIVHQIDEFYMSHPDELGRHVFDVIWTEMVRPAVESSR